MHSAANLFFEVLIIAPLIMVPVVRLAKKRKKTFGLYAKMRMLWIESDYDKISKGNPVYVGDAQVYIAGMEIIFPDTLRRCIILASALGDASIFFETRTGQAGGFIGGVTHANVKVAALKMVELAAEDIALLAPTQEFAYVSPEHVLFFVKTKSGLCSMELPEKEVTQQGHSFYQLYAAGQDIITQYRKVAPRKPEPKSK